MVVLISSIIWGGFGAATSQIKRVEVFKERTERPKVVARSAVTYLIVGSDTREGLTKAEIRELKVGSTKVAAGKRADTMLLVHISKSRDHATIVSIPRDTFVKVPEWTDSKGKVHPTSYSKINATFGRGDAPLLVQTLESMTNLRIDHYIEVSFVGFKEMVDAIGGVEICTKRKINDRKSHLVLPAGTHRLDGITALKYVRTRYFDGMGDLGRMQRQQQFIAAMIREASSAGVILNPVKLVKFIQAALGSVTTDPGLKQDDLITLAEQLRGISTKKVRTLTVPLSDENYYAKGVTAAVLWDKKLAPALWEKLRNDEEIFIESTPKPTTTDKDGVELPEKDSLKSGAEPTPTPTDLFKSRTAEVDSCGALR
ncbi:MAG: LytR family transcriptional regulator [Actinobacteria bacterium]|nr:LytR family transcriptional regulator [Actinomycetota bacterium]